MIIDSFILTEWNVRNVCFVVFVDFVVLFCFCSMDQSGQCFLVKRYTMDCANCDKLMSE